MIYKIRRGSAAVSREEFVREVRWLPDVGPKVADNIYDGATVTIDISGDKAAIAEKRLNSLLKKGVLTNAAVNNAAINDSPNLGEILANATPEKKDNPIMHNPTPGTDLGSLLAAAVLPALQSQVQHLVDEAVGARIPREIVIKAADRPDVKIDGHVHPCFEKVLRLAKAGVSVLLVGPAGCGKTHLFSMVADALGLEHSSISLSGGVTEAHLTGRLLPTGEGGRFVYTQSPFVRRYAEGGAFLLDEMDGADPNVLLAINQATANGGFDIEARAASGLDTFVKRHPNTLLMATANTYGTGAGALYVGRNQLDAATLDRWYTVQMDYDKAYEEKIAPSQVTHFVWRLRELITQNKWRRVASTRMIQKSAAAMAAGLDWKTVKEDILSGYTADERNKITF